MAKLPPTAANVYDAADDLLLERGSMAEVRLADVVKKISRPHGGVGGHFKRWRAERESIGATAPGPVVRAARTLASDVWVIVEVMRRRTRAAAAAARGRAPEPPAPAASPAEPAPLRPARRTAAPVGVGPVRKPAPAATASHQNFGPGFLAGRKARVAAAPPPAVNIRPEWAPKPVQKKKPRAPRKARTPRTAAQEEAFRARAAENLARLRQESGEAPEGRHPKPVRITDWKGAVSEPIAKAVAHELRLAGKPLTAKSLVDKIKDRVPMNFPRPSVTLPSVLAGSRIEKGPQGKFWFSYEEPPPPPRRGAYKSAGTGDALHRAFGETLFQKLLTEMWSSGRAWTRKEMENEGGPRISEFNPEWMHNCIGRAVRDGRLKRSGDGYTVVKDPSSD